MATTSLTNFFEGRKFVYCRSKLVSSKWMEEKEGGNES